MKNKIDWINDRIDIKKMGKSWTVANWCFIICGIILAVFNLMGSWVFHLPWMYTLIPGFVYILAFIIYAMAMLVAFNRNKKNEEISEAKTVKPAEHWIYGILFLGLAIWLSITAYNLFEVLFLEDNPPLTVAGYIIPIILLVLCAATPVVIIVMGVKQLLMVRK